MDGTGELFRGFVAALPGEIQTQIVRYPSDACFSEAGLADLIRSAMPTTEPYVLLAESFSSPLAIQYAATKPENLKGLVLCAGFASSPVRVLTRFAGSLMAPILARMALPAFAIRTCLIGWDASDDLLAAVRLTVSSVRPAVIASRIRFVLACDVRKQLGDIAVPMLYIQANQDRLIPGVCVKEIHRIKPEMAVKAIDGPHLILQREPQRTAEMVAEFVRQLG
jgi:pimeloyl-ACP methyl ester carboxylesterase